jgi:hypothetical protein
MTDNEFKDKLGTTKDNGELVSLSYLRLPRHGSGADSLAF